MLTDVARARVTHDASVDSNRRLSGSPVERWPSNGPGGPGTRGRRIGLRDSKSAKGHIEITAL